MGMADGVVVSEHKVKSDPFTEALRAASCACCWGARRLTDSVYSWEVLVVLADRLPCSHSQITESEHPWPR